MVNSTALLSGTGKKTKSQANFILFENFGRKYVQSLLDYQ